MHRQRTQYRHLLLKTYKMQFALLSVCVYRQGHACTGASRAPVMVGVCAVSAVKENHELQQTVYE